MDTNSLPIDLSSFDFHIVSTSNIFDDSVKKLQYITLENMMNVMDFILEMKYY